MADNDDQNVNASEPTYSGDQLRQARRKARNLGLNPRNGVEAIAMLQERGIDLEDETVSILDAKIQQDEPAKVSPATQAFQMANAAKAGQPASTSPQQSNAEQLARITPVQRTAQAPHPSASQQPQAPIPSSAALTPQAGAGNSLPAVLTSEERDKEIAEIQRNIAERRRKNTRAMFRRLFLFVLLPTIIMTIYYYRVATQMYLAESEFTIEKGGAAMGTLSGGLLDGTSFAKSEDAVSVQDYLQSREALTRLDEEVGFREHYSQDFIDAFKRLPEDATSEDVYKKYGDVIQISYDPGDGIIRMKIRAYDPDTAETYGNTLIRYAEERVDQKTQRTRDEAVKGAESAFEEASQDLNVAKQNFLALQEKQGVFSADADAQQELALIGELESQLLQKEQSLQSLLSNAQPNQARVNGIRLDIQRLKVMIEERRTAMTDSKSSGESLAQISSEIGLAQVELETRQSLYNAALTELQSARLSANQQVRFLAPSTLPIATQEPVYPNKLGSTITAFLVFFGLYIFVSLTIAILREQLTS